jgi:hypothetical protein
MPGNLPYPLARTWHRSVALGKIGTRLAGGRHILRSAAFQNILCLLGPVGVIGLSESSSPQGDTVRCSDCNSRCLPQVSLTMLFNMLSISDEPAIKLRYRFLVVFLVCGSFFPCILAAQSAQPSAGPDPGPDPALQSPAHEATHRPPAAAMNLREKAWQMLQQACTAGNSTDRALATRVLGLIPRNPRAIKLAERALGDEKSEVRSAAAAALGDMKSRTSIPKLKETLNDNDPSVALAAAHSLQVMHDDSAYEIYYEVLKGERKAGKGLVASQKAMLSDPKKMAQLGFEEGIGFIPFAGIGWGAFKTLTKDDASPIRAAAAKVLAHDPDPNTTEALTDALVDKSWLVRAAALEALSIRGNPSVLPMVETTLSDDKTAVRYTAAATVVRLTAVERVQKK